MKTLTILTAVASVAFAASSPAADKTFIDYFQPTPIIGSLTTNTWGAAGVIILPPVIGRLVDITGTFVSGFYVLAGVALAASLGCLALKPPKPGVV